MKYEEEWKQIQAKFQAAAKLIEEANTIAEKAGMDMYEDLWREDENATDELMEALEKCGWQTSSMVC